MDSKDQQFSIEGLIGIVLALAVPLIDPEQPGWRIAILVASGLILLHVVGKSQWVKRSTPILTLKGEFFADDDDTFMRKIRAYGLVVIGITAFGFVSWPSKDVGVFGNVVVLIGPAASQIQYVPTLKGILPNKSDVQTGAETKSSAGGVLGAPVKHVKPAAP
jgi:hypothetical protein